jgi:hypothetical protein
MTKEEKTMMAKIQCYGGILALTEEEAEELLEKYRELHDKNRNAE